MTVSINGTSGIVNDATDLNYTGTLTGGTGVVNLGSGQVYKDASGNVGIGTSSPAATVDAVANSSSFGVSIRGRSADDIGTIGFYSNNGASNTAQIQSRSGEFRIAAIGGTAQTFYTNGSERARINSSGDLLVGTTSFTGYDNAFRFSSGGQQLSRSANGDQIAFFTAGSFSGKISTSGTTTSYATSSDYRLKEDIAPMVGALAKVSELKPVTYKWKATGEFTNGFIAHELAEIVPECVVGEKDAVDADGNPQYQGIDTSFLVATLAAAIQELKAVVDEQATRITALEGTAA